MNPPWKTWLTIFICLWLVVGWATCDSIEDKTDAAYTR